MIIEILCALAIALFIEIFSLLGKRFECIMIITICCTLICTYFYDTTITDNVTDEIDFGIWLIFVILFHKVISIILNKINIKEDIQS